MWLLFGVMQVKAWQSPFILMADRGNCTFVTKVRHAQHAGASGVLVADNVCLCSGKLLKTAHHINTHTRDLKPCTTIQIPSYRSLRPELQSTGPLTAFGCVCADVRVCHCLCVC